MNLSTVYCRTSKGARALSLKNKVLPPSHIQVLTKTDGKLDAKSVMQVIGKLTEYQYTQILIQLINDGFIIAKSDFDETAFFTSNTVHPMVVEELPTKQFFDTSFGSAITRSASTAPVATLSKQEKDIQGKARAQAELDSESDAIAQVQAAIEAKLKLEAEAEAVARARARAKAEAEARAKAEAEALAKAEAEAQAKAEAEARAKAEAEAQAKAEISSIIAKHQHKQPQQTTQHFHIDEEAFGDTFSAMDDDDKRWQASDNNRQDDEVTTNIFQDIATSIQQKTGASKPKRAFSLLKMVGFVLHYLVTFVTRWLTPIALGLVGIVIVLVLLSHIPIVMSPFIDGAQRMASKNIGERVVIHKMHTALLPTPRLVLAQVDVGNASDIAIKSVSILPSWETLFSDSTLIDQVELSGINVTPAQMKRSVGWLPHTQAQANIHISRIHFRDVTIQLNTSKLPEFNAELMLNHLGQVEHAMLTLNGQETTATLVSQGEQYKVTVQAKRFTLPLGAPVLVQSLKAEGLADQQSLTLDHIQGNLYGGSIDGTLTMNWSIDWSVIGKLNIHDAGLGGLAPNFVDIQAKGDLTTTLDFATVSSDIEQILDRPSLKAKFTIQQGEINWIDIVRAIQVAKKNMAINGLTNFDQLSGQLTLKNGRYSYDQLLLKSGNMRASGAFTIQEDQQLKGNIRVNLSTPTRQVKSTLQLTGSSSHPQTK